MFWLIATYYFVVSFCAINIGLRAWNNSLLENIFLVDTIFDWFVVRHLVALGFALACALAMGYRQKKPFTVSFSLGVSGVMAMVMIIYATTPIEFSIYTVIGIILFIASIILERINKTFSFTDLVSDFLFSIALTCLFVLSVDKLGLPLVSVESWSLTGFFGLIQIWLAANCHAANED